MFSKLMINLWVDVQPARLCLKPGVTLPFSCMFYFLPAASAQEQRRYIILDSSWSQACFWMPSAWQDNRRKLQWQPQLQRNAKGKKRRVTRWILNVWYISLKLVVVLLHNDIKASLEMASKVWIMPKVFHKTLFYYRVIFQSLEIVI